LQKLHRLKAGQQKTKCARTEENMAVVDEMALGQIDQLQIHRLTCPLSCASSFTATWFEVIKETPVEELTETNRHSKRLFKTIMN